MGTIFLFVILFIYGFAVILMGCVALKNKKPKNKVHFYITCEVNECGVILRTLWIGKPHKTKDKRFVPHTYSHILSINHTMSFYNLNYSDFEDMKNGEIREVFLNIED